MLIVIRHPEGPIPGLEYASQLAENINGKTHIFNPRTLEQYVESVKMSKPSLKDHTILLASHQDLGSESLPVEIQRQLEWQLANKAGLVYGIESPNTLSTWVGGLDLIKNDPQRLATNAGVSSNRAIFVRKTLGTKFVGRITTDPHTVLVGWAPTGPLKISGIGRQIVTSLPVEWGVNNANSRASDWSGVGFYSHLATAEHVTAGREWLDSSNFVAVGEKAHELLETAGIDHGAVPMPVGNGLFKNQVTTPKYGWLIRDVAKTNDIKLDWKP